jgi:hypothetical protein
VTEPVRRRRSPEIQFLALRATMIAAAVPVLKRLPLHRLARVLEPRGRVAGSGGLPAPVIVQVVDNVIGRGRPLIRGGCMTTGLTRYWFLRRAGLDVALCFGVGKLGGQDAAHCWLEHEGVPFFEPMDPRPIFTTVATISAARLLPGGPLRVDA